MNNRESLFIVSSCPVLPAGRKTDCIKFLEASENEAEARGFEGPEKMTVRKRNGIELASYFVS